MGASKYGYKRESGSGEWASHFVTQILYELLVDSAVLSPTTSLSDMVEVGTLWLMSVLLVCLPAGEYSWPLVPHQLVRRSAYNPISIAEQQKLLDPELFDYFYPQFQKKLEKKNCESFILIAALLSVLLTNVRGSSGHRPC